MASPTSVKVTSSSLANPKRSLVHFKHGPFLYRFRDVCYYVLMNKSQLWKGAKKWGERTVIECSKI
jgi:hypothetical protein